MTDFLLATAGVILFTVAVGLVRILSRPGDADRMMAAQLIGTGGIGSLLLIAAATGARGVEDVALGLALLAAFASAAFVNSAAPAEEESRCCGRPISLVDLVQYRGDRRRRLFLPCRHGGIAALP